MTEQPEQFRSHFLVGTIRHRRDRVVTSDFTHHVWYLALDLDEQNAVDRRLALLSSNRHNFLELRDVDHLDGGSGGLRAEVSRRLLSHGFDPMRMRVTLIAYPRVFGYVFNPVSFYLCHDAANTLRAVLAEVHNTHGDREVYDFLPDAGGGPVFKGAQDKRMYVSPFIAADAQYELLVWEDDERLAITIRENEGDEPVLVARLQVRRVPLTNRNLLRLLASDPLVPLKTSALIFWHAIRLWWRGVPWHRYRRNPDQADRPTTETTMSCLREVSPEADLPGPRPELPSGTVRPPYGGSSITLFLSSLRQRVVDATNDLFAHAPYPLDGTGRYRGDPGLFGPDSVTWLVVGDAAVFVGGIRALLVQAAHPEVVAGVFDHSRFREDPLGRLSRTSAYVTATSFGALPEVELAVRTVSRAHRPIAGLSHRGREYSASAPALAAWVHNALTDSFLVAYQHFGAQWLTDEEADRFVCEQAKVGELLGAVPLPLAARSLASWVNELPDLAPSPGMAEAISFLQSPPLPPPVKLVYRILFEAAVTTLPPRVRSILGLRSWPGAHLIGLASIRILRRVLGRSPSWLLALRRVDAPLSEERAS